MGVDVLVIGAGPAGLAVAGALNERGRRLEIIEKAEQVGASWRGHYERLHLHTVKALSALPGMSYTESSPRYVPRQGVVDYLEAYADKHALRPHFGEQAVAIVPVSGGWLTTAASGREFRSQAVVVASGANSVAEVPAFDGIDRFAGRVLHSHDYRNARTFAGQRVLVVGMGNTGAEIALDLAESGVRTTLSVRSPVNIVHRDVLGRPSQLTAIALSRLPTRLADAIARTVRDLTVGDLSRHGLRTSPMSPLRQLREEGKTPVIDVGTLARIRSGEIRVRPGIDRFADRGVTFADGTAGDFDSVVLATGYRSGIERLFPAGGLRLDRRGLPLEMVGTDALAGVYFVGFDVRQPGGLLRTIAIQATAVAETICRTAPA